MPEIEATQEIGFKASEFLKSINVSYDIGVPERVSHFHPTSKSLPLIREFIQGEHGRNQIVVAPYGSGKSLLATFAGQLLENRKESFNSLRAVVDRVQDSDPALALSLMDRIGHQDPNTARPGGLTISLNGHQEDLGSAWCRGLADGMDRLGIRTPLVEDLRNFQGQLDFALKATGSIKKTIQKDALESGFKIEKILIVWDEFGRHLEELIAGGDSGRLNEIQLIAEFSSRQKMIPFAFTVFLHQSLANYASGLSQSVRNEWKKIEGRFETTQFVDDGLKILRLIGKIVEKIRPSSSSISAALENDTLASLKEVGLFQDMQENEREDLVRMAYPLEPATLHLLPRVSARAAQNERTLFSFLYSVDLSSPISPKDIFNYFEETMRTDTGVGGSFHQWHETQNAIEMVSEDLPIEILKTAGVLGLGITGQRSRVSKVFLTHAATGYRHKKEAVQAVMESLIAEKLLLYRKTTDHVAVWYGVDVDLQGRLEQEKTRYAYAFDLMAFLKSELPPRTWMPLEYNAEYRMTRYFPSRYVSASELKSEIRSAEEDLENGTDGIILHVIPDGPDDIGRIDDVIAKANPSRRIVFSVPKKAVPIYDRALEVYALHHMQEDDALVGEDPLVLPELRIMSDDALMDLNRTMKNLTAPQTHGPTWFIDQRDSVFGSVKELRSHLSKLCFSVFNKTPKLNNELVVRKKPRPNIANSRKKLISAILNNDGTETLGLEGFRPDSSMLRTLLIHTGIYRQKGDVWSFADPEEIMDPNLRNIWVQLKSLFQEPGNEPKNLNGFFAQLMSPPTGLRPGLFPVFFTSGMVAFGKSITLLHNGTYITDILPSVIESICRSPSEFELYVHELEEKDIAYLSGVSDAFDGQSKGSSDAIRAAFDNINGWYTDLPPAALKTRRLSSGSSRLLKAISRMDDPVNFLFRELPGIFASNKAGKCDIDELQRHIDEINSLLDKYYENAEATIREALHIRETGTLPQDVRQWTSLIPRNLVKSVSDSRAIALFNRLKMPQDTAKLLIDSVGDLITEKTVNRWDDSSVTEFDRLFRAAIANIEEHAIVKAKSTDKGVEQLTGLAVSRFEHLFDFLIGIVGKKTAKEKVMQMLKEID